MASRKEQKEAARQRRLAEEQARQERAARERRLRMLAGMVLAAAAVIAAAIAISSSSGGATGLQKGAAKNATDTAVQSFLAGIPQSGNVLGNPNAPVTMTYYGDLECPVCQAFTLGNSGGGWPQFVSNEVRKGKVKVVYRAYETATRDPSVFKNQQVAALAAGKQNKFWNYIELFYHEQGAEDTGYVTDSYLSGLASQIPGLNISQWQAARNDSSLGQQVTADVNSAVALGVNGTPTMLAKGPKGQSPLCCGSIPTYSQLQQLVRQVS
jgi:protein-disulfide isomerase